MVNFSNISKHKPQAENPVRLELDIPGLDEIVVLWVLPALLINKPLANAQQRFSAIMEKRLKARKGADLTVEDLEKARETLLSHYAKYVLRGWENVLDTDFQEVPFSEENAELFLRALRDETFDEIVDFCRTADNFVDVPDAEDLGKP